MKPLPLIAIAALTSALVSASMGALLGERVAASDSTADDVAPALERLSEQVADLGRDQLELAAELRRLGEREQLQAVPSARMEVGEIDAAVARWMETHAELAAASSTGAGQVAQAAAVASPEARLQAALDQLDGDLSETDRQRLWRKFAAEDLTDAIVEAWEERAAREPNNPDMQVALGGIYLNKIVEVGNSPEAGQWATKADRSFDAALELDERHWNARFSKAVALSFWPPVFGKQGEAIQHFETLVAQQIGGPQQPQFAQTHLLLGNLYTQMGNKQKAMAAWQAGLAQFPGNEDLTKQLAIHEGQ